jgi:hypothetical protein
MNNIEVMKQALGFVKANHSGGPDAFGLITALEQAIKQEEQQPVPVKTYHDGKPWPVDGEAKGAIMGAAYDFRDAHISGSMNLKRSAHAALEAAVDAALNTPPAAQPAVPEVWQPIETAPKDFCTEFDGWNGKRVPDVSWAKPEFNQRGDYAWCVQQYENGYGWANVEVKGLTHWRPIPTAPEKGHQ